VQVIVRVLERAGWLHCSLAPRRLTASPSSPRFMTKTNGLGELYARVIVCTSWNKVLICISSLFCSLAHIS
jgi:hypothetical protein